MTEEEATAVMSPLMTNSSKRGDLWHRAVKQRYHDFSMCGKDVGRATYEKTKEEIRCDT